MKVLATVGATILIALMGVFVSIAFTYLFFVKAIKRRIENNEEEMDGLWEANEQVAKDLEDVYEVVENNG